MSMRYQFLNDCITHLKFWSHTVSSVTALASYSSPTRHRPAFHLPFCVTRSDASPLSAGRQTQQTVKTESRLGCSASISVRGGEKKHHLKMFSAKRTPRRPLAGRLPRPLSGFHGASDCRTHRGPRAVNYDDVWRRDGSEAEQGFNLESEREVRGRGAVLAGFGEGGRGGILEVTTRTKSEAISFFRNISRT